MHLSDAKQKKAEQKRVHPIWFLLYEILEKENSRDRKQVSWGCNWSEWGMSEKSPETFQSGRLLPVFAGDVPWPLLGYKELLTFFWHKPCPFVGTSSLV